MRRSFVAVVALGLVASVACAPEPRAPSPHGSDTREARVARARALPRPSGPPGHRRYPVHRGIPATIFWVGEPATRQNGCTANLASAFDHDWIGAYGGCDAASPRVTEQDGWNRPEGFAPAQNPYYFALPYGSNDDAPFRDEVPWIDDRPHASSIRDAVKDRWIAVRRFDRTCYAQWEDVGPFCADDVAYVFGGAPPRNDGRSCEGAGPTSAEANGTASGLDLSPAVAHCLGVRFETGLVPVDWWFVDDDDVPDGPWRRVVTRAPVRDGPPRPPGACAQTPPWPACG